MKALKIIGNIFGVLIAIILSVALFAMLIATPVITSLGLVTKPETIHAVITQPEVVEMITELPGVSENLEAAGMDEEFIHEVTQSQFFEDVVHLYTEQTVDGVTGVSTEHVTVEQVQEVIENNKEEVIDLVRPISGNYTEDGQIPSDEEIEEMIDYAVENYAQDFLDSLPSGQELLDMLEGYSGDISGLIGSYGPAGGDTVGAPLKMSLPGAGDLVESVQSGDAQRFYSAVIRFVLDGTAQKVLIATIVLLSVLILLFRFPRFKGFMWLTVIYLLGGGILMACSVLLTYRPFEEELAHFFHIAVVIFELIAVHIRHYAIAFLIVGAACLVVFIIGRIVLKLVKRSKAKKTVAAKTETQPTVVATNVPEAVTAAAAAVAPVEETPAEEIPEEETEAEEILAEEEEAPAEEEASVEEETAEEKEACTEEVLEEDAEAEEAHAEEPKAEEIVTAE